MLAKEKRNLGYFIILIVLCVAVVLVLVGCKKDVDILGTWMFIEDPSSYMIDAVFRFNANGKCKWEYATKSAGVGYWFGWYTSSFSTITDTEGWIEGNYNTPISSSRCTYKIIGDIMEIYSESNVLLLKLKKE